MTDTEASDGIRVEHPRPDVTRIVLARPETRNAQDTRLLYALDDAYTAAMADDAVKVVILAGDGPHFSSGHDLRDRYPMDEYQPRSGWGGFDLQAVEGWYATERELYVGLCLRWRDLPKPIIAEVHGRVIAAGLMLVWPCDLVIATDDTEFSDPVVAFGVTRGFALTDIAELPPDSMQAVMELNQYVLALLAERRAAPQDDLLSMLMRERDGEQLDDMEITFFFLLLLVAGNETTTNLLSNLFHELATHPDQWAHLRAGRASVEAATEEALRHTPPIQGFFRDAADDAVVRDMPVPDGDRVLLLWASANRDERHYDDPERFDVRRSVEDHMAFGHGIHVCLGAHLARLEVHAVLRRMLERFDRLEPDGPAHRTHNPTLRGFEQLPLRGHPAT